MRSLGQAQIRYDCYSYKKRKVGHRHAGGQCEAREKTAIYKPRIKASEETNPAYTLMCKTVRIEIYVNQTPSPSV